MAAWLDPIWIPAIAVLVGLAAGALTTVAGFGGGLLVSLALVPLLGPVDALVVAAPALALGHLHRALAYRDQIDAEIARRFVLGAAPGALLGALVLAWVPASVAGWALVLGAGLATAQARGWISVELGQRAVIPGAVGVGFLASSAGAGGVLLPPTLMAAGLAGRRFVATAAAGAVAVQVVRVGGYVLADMVTLAHVPAMIAVALGQFPGNQLGRRLAARLDDRGTARWTRAALAGAIALGVVGLLAGDH